MPQLLKGQVIAQDHAVDALCRSLKRNRAGLGDEGRPMGSFLFAGPTGVGKTLLAKKLAKYLFGSEDALIRVDMSEYMEKFNASKLGGSPPGYVGYEEAGQLSEKVRRRPYSVVLFDEVEKAHPDVMNTLLQILDDGIMTDGQGRKINFKNTIIILTSNIGSRNIVGQNKSLGFATDDPNVKVTEMVLGDVKEHFASEFLNRLDGKIVFNKLTDMDLDKILDLELVQMLKKPIFVDHSIDIVVTPAVNRPSLYTT